MQVALIREHGDPSVIQIEQKPVPEPGPGEVLVRVLAVSINHLDLWVRRGMPGMPIPFPRILGCDGTGEIAAFGEGTEEAIDLKVGDTVVIEPGYSSGTSDMDLAGLDHLSDDYGVRGEHCDGLDAEFVAIEARFLTALPDGIDPIQAAAMPLAFVTAWGMLVTRVNLQPEETVLVLGGTSGVGSAAIQIAKYLGATVIATAGTEAKRDLAGLLGADDVIDHSAPGWSKRVREFTDGRGADVVVEHVGPATWKDSTRSLARNGRLVTCGGTTGPEVSIQLPHLFIKNISILGSTMGPRDAYSAIFEAAAAGAFKPVVDRVLPMSEIVSAHAALENREVLGKVVLIPGQ
ncbi:MAG: zinc-binding dehydrogenase [Planctomycetota bacterium]|nr:zinc-binding dehydrogenase [Planctomycetota bacterium]MDG2142402.1 zinc-binding dehydrogenase [Planctomycetota bacterium]